MELLSRYYMEMDWPHGQTNLVIVHNKLSLLFWYFIKTSYHLDQYGPSNPSTNVVNISAKHLLNVSSHYNQDEILEEHQIKY